MDMLILFEKILHKRNLSYRRWQRTGEPQLFVGDFKLYPNQFNMMMKVKGIMKDWSWTACQNWVIENYDSWEEWVSQKQDRITLYNKKEKEEYALQELIFRGFYPCKDALYRRIPKEELKDHGIPFVQREFKYKPKYAYIITNKKLENDYWIYPIRFSSNYNLMQKGYLDIHSIFPKISLQGYTRIIYPELESYPKLD